MCPLQQEMDITGKKRHTKKVYYSFLMWLLSVLLHFTLSVRLNAFREHAEIHHWNLEVQHRQAWAISMMHQN